MITLNKIVKIFDLFRFILIYKFFKDASIYNFLQRNIKFNFLNKIQIGRNNKFYSYSRFIIEDNFTNEHIIINNNNTISHFVILNSHGGYIKIGSHNFLGERTQIQGKGGVEIGNNVLIAPNVFISSSNHNYHNPTSFDYLKSEIPNKVIINDNVWIGANCVITSGVTIGENSIIAAGTIVTKNVRPFTMVAGNPSKEIKIYDFDLHKWVKTNILIN